MIITALYIYGITQSPYEYSWFYLIPCFIGDIIISAVISPKVGVQNSNEISKEEEYYWKKRTQVEELKRIKLDRELYGK